MRRLPALLLLIICILGACQPEDRNETGLSVVTPIPTLDVSNPNSLCDEVNTYWDIDWELTIRVLLALDNLDANCTDADTHQQLYDAYIAYGDILRADNDLDNAIIAYQTSLIYRPAGEEALTHLTSLQTPEEAQSIALPSCGEQNTLSDLPTYQAIEHTFVSLNATEFRLANQRYPVYGINYYPRDYPNRRFLREMDIESIEFELELMRASGINTLRIYLRHNQLFDMTCIGNSPIPLIEGFNRLDTFIRVAESHDFRLILVLNHEPDLTTYPLYTAPTSSLDQMRFIAQRYQDEGTILAYDLRDNGDADYINSNQFTREEVLNWLTQAVIVMRQYAPNHLITAGWDDDAQITAPLVDFVSFQHFGVVATLRQEIAILTDATQRPILLTAIGYNTYDMDELSHREAYQRAFEAVAQNNLTGWVVTTAFDYPLTVICEDPNCPAEDGGVSRAGLWNTSYFPKRAVEAVEAVTGISSEN